MSEEFKYEWVSIPHIFSTPFYVYAYSFGQLLVYALYKRYQDEGESFKPKYLRLLSAGGSVAPIELLQETGMDVTQEAFWQGGFDLIDDMVRKLEKQVIFLNDREVDPCGSASCFWAVLSLYLVTSGIMARYNAT